MRRLALVLLAALAPAALEAQQWKSIGTVASSGSEIFVRLSSVARAGDSVTALVLVRYREAQYVAAAKDSMRAVTTLVTMKCPVSRMVVKETIFYSDFDRGRVVRRSKPKVPGYQTVMGPTMPRVRDYLCPAVGK